MALWVCIGCQVRSNPSSVWEEWARREGGFAAQSFQARAQSALEALNRSSQNIRVSVLGSQHVGAYAWPDGSIFLTSALVEILDPQETAAVIAHELGHLDNH